MSPRCPPKVLDILTFLTLYLLFFLVHMNKRDQKKRREVHQGTKASLNYSLYFWHAFSDLAAPLLSACVDGAEPEHEEHSLYVCEVQRMAFCRQRLLWAGLVMQLSKAIQDSFGKLQLGLFRVVQHDKWKMQGRRRLRMFQRTGGPKSWSASPFGR